MLQTGNRDGGDQYKPRTLHVFRVEHELPEDVAHVDDFFDFNDNPISISAFEGKCGVSFGAAGSIVWGLKILSLSVKHSLSHRWTFIFVHTDGQMPSTLVEPPHVRRL